MKNSITKMSMAALLASMAFVGSTIAMEPDPSGVKQPEKVVKPVKKTAPDAPKKEEAGPKIGEDAPDWSLKDRDGKTIKLSDLKGKIVVMDFWATWCGPCKAAMPGVQKLHEEFKDKGVLVFGLDTWEKDDTKPNKEGKTQTAEEKAKAYMDSKSYTYGLLFKADDVAKKYAVSGIPTFYVIGADGKVLYKAVGSGKDKEEKMKEIISSALANKEEPKKETPKPAPAPATEPAKKG